MEDPDKLHHLFAKPEQAFQALHNEVNAAFARGRVVVDTLGLYRHELDVAENRVIVGGAVVDGVPKIGTAWILA